jgi:predicted ester cyclase
VKQGNDIVGRQVLTNLRRATGDAMNSPSGSAETNTALVLESIEALNAGDTERLLAAVAPDIIIHYAEMPEPLQGRETWRQGFELMRQAFPDLKAQVDDLVASDDKVAFA